MKLVYSSKKKLGRLSKNTKNKGDASQVVQSFTDDVLVNEYHAPESGSRSRDQATATAPAPTQLGQK